MHVLDDTADAYRFFDATPHAEFLYECVERTIEVDLPNETSFLRDYDTFRRQIGDIVDMPDRTIGLLVRFLRQNGGTISKRGREQEFVRLSDEEVARVEAIYGSVFRC